MIDLEILSKYADCEDLHISRIDTVGYDKTKPTILIIDDSKSVIILFKRLVRRMKLEKDFNVLYSDGTDAALSVLKTVYCDHHKGININLVLSDITFGGAINVKGELRTLNGIELVGVLSKIYPDIRYEFITGHTVDEDIRPELFEEFRNYNKTDSLKDFVTYKNIAISTDKDLIYNLLKGSIYEHYIEDYKE